MLFLNKPQLYIINDLISRCERLALDNDAMFAEVIQLSKLEYINNLLEETNFKLG